MEYTFAIGENATKCSRCTFENDADNSPGGTFFFEKNFLTTLPEFAELGIVFRLQLLRIVASGVHADKNPPYALYSLTSVSGIFFIFLLLLLLIFVPLCFTGIQQGFFYCVQYINIEFLK